MMKNAHTFKIPSLIFAAAVSAGFGFVFPAAAQQSDLVDLNTRQVTSLGTLDFGFGSAINDSGQVAGYSYTPAGNYHALLLDPTASA
ncbi:hypothetical protein [Nitrosospira sp. Is2]|uniref:hypothetical protein n=1 Tax=Nitrosospira sp. Is2 TaxID=3080532 RepID=UPI00295529A6|nr:hypothetical protein [Nitrosospira sp. Is2]WON73917.1 hypothetical protein R5L00_00055 [Nitrosospira sp. Is2]